MTVAVIEGAISKLRIGQILRDARPRSGVPAEIRRIRQHLRGHGGREPPSSRSRAVSTPWASERIGWSANTRDSDRKQPPTRSARRQRLVRSNVYAEAGAYAFIRNLLVRLRKPDGAFDATMLLVADWDDETRTLNSVEDPAEELSASRFFADILNAVMNNTPVDIHQELRLRKHGEPEGGMPPLDEEVVPEETG